MFFDITTARGTKFRVTGFDFKKDCTIDDYLNHPAYVEVIQDWGSSTMISYLPVWRELCLCLYHVDDITRGLTLACPSDRSFEA